MFVIYVAIIFMIIWKYRKSIERKALEEWKITKADPEPGSN
jgi:hypothetical protein